MKQSKQNVLAIFLIALAITAVSLVVSVSTTIAKNDNVSEKSEKNDDKSEKNNEKAQVNNNADVKSKSVLEDVSVKNQGKAENVKSETKEGVTDSEEVIAVKEKKQKQEETSQEVAVVVGENEVISEEVEETIAEVEGRNKFKTLLIGTDYKNLGQLRSSLVQNRNQIRKLTQAMQSAAPADQVLIEAQLLALTQEREEIKSVIMNNQEGFSVLGWAVRLINGYENEPIDESEEDVITEEVQDAINNNGGDGEVSEQEDQEVIEENEASEEAEAITTDPVL